MLQFFLFLLFAAEYLMQSVSIANECKTPEDGVGTCIDFPACGILKEPVESIEMPLPKSLKDYLLSSHCGFNGRIPKVCCPKPGTSLDWIYTYHRNVNLLTKNSCGFSTEPRIVGGAEAELSEFPWIALLVYNTKGMPYQCGGSVITERYILTAAHCIIFDLKRVRLGEHRISTDRDCKYFMGLESCNPPVQEFEIEETITHPSYRRFTHNADIALIRLKGSIDFSQGIVKPVCLPLYNNLRNLNLSSKNLTVIGWGITEHNKQSDVLLKVAVEVLDNGKCKEKYGSRYLKPYLDENKICAGKEGQDSCNGDSGGPLMFFGIYDDKLRYVQHGIVSYGSVLCGIDLPGVYTRVSKYMKWILDNLRP